MGFLDSLKAWFSNEATEARDVGEKTMSRLETDLSRREADLQLSPEQRLEQLQGEIEQNDSTFDEMQEKIEGRGALADAAETVASLDTPDELTNPVDDDQNTDS